ncbi:unnamed protein product [Closterium sp. NIES-54]
MTTEVAGRNIVVAVDESEQSFYALQWAFDHIIRKDADKTILVTVETPITSSAGAFAIPEDNELSVEDDKEQETKSVAERAEAICKENQSWRDDHSGIGDDHPKCSEIGRKDGILTKSKRVLCGCQVTSVTKVYRGEAREAICQACEEVTSVTKVYQGEAREAICQACEENEASMLVIGSHGHGPVKRSFLGSVSDYCSKYARSVGLVPCFPSPRCASPPPVCASPPPVCASPPPVCASPPPVCASPPPVCASPPPVCASPPPVCSPLPFPSPALPSSPPHPPSRSFPCFLSLSCIRFLPVPVLLPSSHHSDLLLKPFLLGIHRPLLPLSTPLLPYLCLSLCLTGVQWFGTVYSGASAGQPRTSGMALAQSFRHTRRFHSAFTLPARSFSAGGFLASGQSKGPEKAARAPLARAAAGADGLFNGQQFMLTLEVTEGKQVTVTATAQAKDVLASGRFRATVLPDLPAPAGFRDFLQLPLSLLPLPSSSSSPSPTSSVSHPTSSLTNPPVPSLTFNASSLDESTQSQEIPLTANAGNPSVTGSTTGSQATLAAPGSSVAAQAVAQVLTVAAQVKTSEAVRQQMVEKAVQVAGGREGSSPGALLLLSGAHPMRSWPLMSRLMPTNSLHVLRDAHRLREAGQIPRCVQLWAVENPLTGSVDRLEQKLEAGAEAIILQPPVVPEAFQQWWCAAEQRGLTTAVPMIIGMPLITSARNLAFWMLLTDAKGGQADTEIARFRQAEEQVAGTGVVDVERFRTFRQQWTEQYLTLAKQLKGASGLHFMPINPRGWKDLRRLISTSHVFSSL